MKSEMINDQIEYIQELNASYMAYQLLPDEAWHEYQLKMMLHNNIPGLVPMTYYVVDGKKSFRYNLTGLISLDLYLSRKEPDRQELAQYMLQILDCLTTAETYLLEYSRFILEVPHTYLDLTTRRIYMIYMPIKYDEKVDFETINRYLQDVLYAYTGDASPNLSVMINQLNAKLRGSYRSLAELKRELLEILNEEQSSGMEQQSVEAAVLTPIVEPSANVRVEKPLRHDGDRKASTKNRKLAGAGLSKKTMALIGLGLMNCILIATVAVFWSRLLELTGGVLSSVMGVVLLVVPLNYFTGKAVFSRLNMGSEQPVRITKADSSSNQRKDQPLNQKQARPPKIKSHAPKSSERVSILSTKEKFKPTRAPEVPQMEIEQQPGPQTIIAAQPVASPRTELLSERQLYLVHLQDRDSLMTAPIESDRFIIGRQNDLVDLCLNDPTIGRIHAEIKKDGDSYFVVDLNSKNGTRVNNERIVSNMPIELKEGDCIVFSTKAFYFRKGKG